MDAVTAYIPALLHGLLVTLLYFAIGTAGSMIFALPVALGIRSSNHLIRIPAISYVEFFRNTPLLVQLFWLHFALPSVTGVNMTASQTAALAIILVMTAYMAEVYRAGFNGVPRGQLEAAGALGLSPRRCWQLIILPQAFQIALPAIGNTLVSLLKATSILSILAVPELMRITSRISDYTAKPVIFYSLTAFLYVFMGLLLSIFIRRLERYLGRWGTR